MPLFALAFNAAVKAGVQTVMNSFNEIGGQPVASSRRLLTEVLRGELGFNGFVISDWCAIQQLKNHGVAENDKQAAELSLNAGIDMDMVDECYIDYVAELIEEGKISIETLDNAVGNVLRVKLRLGFRVLRNMKLIKPNISDTQGSLPERAWFCLKTKTMFCRLKKTNAWHWQGLWQQ